MRKNLVDWDVQLLEKVLDVRVVFPESEHRNDNQQEHAFANAQGLWPRSFQNDRIHHLAEAFSMHMWLQQQDYWHG